MSRPRVVVTGIGAITSLGTGKDELWKALLAGTSGIKPVQSFDVSRYRVSLGGEIHDFSPERWIKRLDASEIGRASQFAVAAARLAFEDAGLDPSTLDPTRVGVSMGTTSGEPREVERFDDSFVSDDHSDLGAGFISRYPCHVIAANVASEFDLAGPNIMIPTACAAGSYAMAHATDILRDGGADVMIAGGSDSFSRITYTGFARLGAIAKEKCQPFDKNRQGMVPGEGAAILVLEPEDKAKARGATIIAELAGYGLSCDAHHMTAAHPEADGARRAMQAALSDAGLSPDAIGYISAHGTGTATNDKIESMAAHRVFGDERGRKLPISSIKSMLGHTMGAASAIEAAVCSMAVRDNMVPPTINFEEKDPECDVDCVPNEAREVEVGSAMNNAYAFGGNNASVIFSRYQEGA